jgi:hypothetical protein
MSDQSVRNPGQIRQQLKQVIFRHLQRELKESFKRTPERCRFNQDHDVKGLGIVHLCMFADRDKDKPRKMLCDTRQWGGLRQARNCSQWSPKLSKELIKARFRDRLADPVQRVQHYPDIAALMWVLDGGVLEEVRSAEVEFDQTELVPENVEPDAGEET